jgi:hypothetical protein
MIGASQRGQLCGFQIGETIKIRSVSEARRLAHLLHEELDKAHYAHIEPEPEFIGGVVMGIASRQVILPDEKGKGTHEILPQ